MSASTHASIEECGYVLGATIGHGAYAKVKLAKHLRTNKRVRREQAMMCD